MKTPIKFLGLVLLFLFAESGFAQLGQLNITTRKLTENLEVFFLSGIDRNSGDGQPRIFEVIISGQLAPTEAHTVRLSLRLSKNQILLYSGETNTFVVTGRDLPLIISNKQLFSRHRDFGLDGEPTPEGRDLIKDLILKTGSFPIGHYTFDVTLTDLTNPNVIEIEPSFFFDLTNPGKLDLLYPGAPATGRRSDCPEIFTNVPPIRWDGDMRFYLVTIAEARPGEDPEGALNQSPNFRRLFAVGDLRNAAQAIADLGINARVERIPNTSFQYPPSGEVLQFRPGKTYIWRVTGIVNSSSGPVRIDSEIFCFRLARLGELNTGGEQLKLILRQLLGPDDFKKLFGEGGELDGYLPKRISWNGEEMTPGELFFKVYQQKPEVSGYSVE